MAGVLLPMECPRVAGVGGMVPACGGLRGYGGLGPVAGRVLSRRFPLTGSGRPHNGERGLGERTCHPTLIGAQPLALDLASGGTRRALGAGMAKAPART